MAYQEIICESADRVLTITLNRPERLNAWTKTMDSELKQALTDAENDDQIRAIILTGAGRGFCAGADLKDTRSSTPSGAWKFAQLMSMRKPVIGAINGPCVGIGFVLSLYFDIRMANESARMGVMFPRRGLVLESGLSWLLPRMVGLGRAMELSTTGRMVGAKEALELGLVSYVLPDDRLMEKAREVAQDIAINCAPVSVAESKRQIYKHLFADFDTAEREDERTLLQIFKSEDRQEAYKAFVEKRQPQWKGR